LKSKYESRIQLITTQVQQFEANGSTQAPPSSSQSGGFNAQDQEKIKSLEAMLKKMNDITTKQKDEMTFLKDKAKERLTTASNNIKTLKSEYNKLREAFTKVCSLFVVSLCVCVCVLFFVFIVPLVLDVNALNSFVPSPRRNPTAKIAWYPICRLTLLLLHKAHPDASLCWQTFSNNVPLLVPPSHPLRRPWQTCNLLSQM
jgi:hypothetical protein